MIYDLRIKNSIQWHQNCRGLQDDYFFKLSETRSLWFDKDFQTRKKWHGHLGILSFLFSATNRLLTLQPYVFQMWVYLVFFKNPFCEFPRIWVNNRNTIDLLVFHFKIKKLFRSIKTFKSSKTRLFFSLRVVQLIIHSKAQFQFFFARLYSHFIGRSFTSPFKSQIQLSSNT